MRKKNKCLPKMLIAEYLKKNLRITLSLHPAENVAAERMAIEPWILSTIEAKKAIEVFGKYIFLGVPL